MFETLESATLVASFILPNTDEAVHQAQHTGDDGGDDNNDETVLISWSVLRSVHQRADEITC